MQAAVVATLLFLAACGTKVVEKPVERLYAQFSIEEVVDHTNALRSIIDWPKETLGLQKAWGLGPKDAKRLMPPLQALWDEKIEVFADGNLETIEKLPVNCAILCHCTFYQMAIEKRPELSARGVVVTASKEGKNELLQCQKVWRQNPKLIALLKEEAAKAEAPSAY